MDTESSVLFPEQMDDLFHLPSIPFSPDFFQEANLTAKSCLPKSDVTGKTERSRQPKLPSDSVSAAGIDHKTRKKMMHRDFERQRRLEMTALYRSLRSLLPPDFLKGRSVADQMQGVVKYIQHMQKRVEKLNEKRDELKKSPGQSSTTIIINGEPNYVPISFSNKSVQVEASKSGIHVMVSTDLNGRLPASRVVDVLIKQGLAVVSCISTTTNGTSLHIIQSEVNEGKEINPSELQTRLTALLF